MFDVDDGDVDRSTNEDPDIARRSHRDPFPPQEEGVAERMEEVETIRSRWIQPVSRWLNELENEEGKQFFSKYSKKPST